MSPGKPLSRLSAHFSARAVLMLLLICTPLPGWADLLATVDKTTITEYEILTLTVTWSGTDPGGAPGFAPLRRDFEILGQSSQSSSSIRSTNGRTERSLTTDWIVQLRARQRGNFVIPPLQLGPHRSNPIPITVAARTVAAARRAAEVIFFETSVDARSVYVQAQLIYTVRLYWSESITGEFPAAPELDDAVIETLVDENRFSTVLENRRYNVLEKQYAIFPQHSGQLTLPKEVFNGARGRDTLFNFSRNEPVYAESKPLTIDVKPRPPAFPTDAPWLPAASLDIQARWSDDADISSWTVGGPISRTLTLTADGVAASALPPLTGSIPDGMRTYPDPPAIDEAVFEGGLRATRIETLGLVPETSGPFNIPDVRIPWWNTRTDALEIAVVPGLQANVAAAPITHHTWLPPSAPSASDLTITPTTVTRPGLWPWVALVFGVLWCISTVQWFLARRQLGRVYDNRPKSPHLPDEQVAFRTVLTACASNDASTTNAALRRWCYLRWGFWSPSELGRRTGPEVAGAIADLDAALYQPTMRAWNGAELRAALQAVRPDLAPSRVPTRGQLATLNPE